MRIALVTIILGAAALRMFAVGLGHPFLSFQPDEDANGLRALRLAHGALNPEYFYYPPLLWYLLAGVYRLVFWCGRALGLLSTWDDFTRFYDGYPTLLYLGRLLSVGFGTATVACLYLLGRRAFSPTHGILAAGFLAAAFLHVRDSALSTTEAPLTFFIVLTLLGAVRVHQDGRIRDYALVGLAAGLASATKYNAVLVLVSLGVAHVLRRGGAGVPLLRALPDGRLISAAVLAGFVFIALDPFLLVDWQAAWGRPDDFGSLAWEWRYLRTVEYLDLSPVWWYHLCVSLRYGMGMAILVLALTGLLLRLRLRDGPSLVLLSFVLTFFTAMASLQAVFVRYMTPLVPVLCLFAAVTVQSATQRLRWPRLRPWVTAGLALLAILEPLEASAAYGRMKRHVDTRIETFQYVRTELPPGSRVATYGPSVTWRSTIPRWLPEMYAKDPAQDWPDVFGVLKSRGVRYLLVHRSPLDVFSPPTPELDRAIQGSATFIREFSPYRPGTQPAPLFDRNDSYYFPVGRFRGVVRPGPLVELYRLD